MRKSKQDRTPKPVGLKDLASYLGLSTATISTVLNAAPAAGQIPEATQARILAAAEKFNYRPNAMARSLRGMRSHTVGVLVPEISEGYGALVLGAVGDYLLSKNYFLLVATHRRKPELLEEYHQLTQRLDGEIIVFERLKEELQQRAAQAEAWDADTTPGDTY